ncbi:amidohydrolase family protein [Pedobacter antarcticus]|uniref:Pterin-binding domain-containing protein n=2 Tax=Pedobacter antarcticus TaxID=34086 RepID=A0A081PG90_9SPHI|nr:amidohydrolase family protein [Pedobacter antarcticus]KEQ29713.1 hypothetical protein N180_16995 [Pedobacter antarcticus 4BY]SDM35339.1 Imidazolonepropionase [Pedobacter antarcticus]SFE96032.1 Imidazolonepropionase [Pedobacter antarcticus]
MKKLLFTVLCCIPILLSAQSNKYLIKAGQMFDSGNGTFVKGCFILVSGNKIIEVKKEQELTDKERADYTLLDLSGYTVLPGLIDAHTHLLFREELKPHMDYSAQSLLKTLTMEGDAYRAIYGTVRANAYLQEGITAVQDLGNSGQFADIALMNAIDNGLVPGPRMRSSGPGLASEGGQLPGVIYKHRHLADDEYRIVNGRDEIIKAVRENVNQGATVIKIFADNVPNRTSLSVQEMESAVKEAHRYGLRVTAHATDAESIHNAVLAGVDGIEHGYNVQDSTLQLMAKRGVILVPTDGDSTVMANYARIAYPGEDSSADMASYLKRLAKRLNRAIKMGVTIAAGSDDYIDVNLPYGLPSKHTLIGYHEAGVSIPDVLKFATVNAAKQLNWEKRIGIIRKGYLADIIAVDINLENDINSILQVHFVMKDGVIYKGGKPI